MTNDEAKELMAWLEDKPKLRVVLTKCIDRDGFTMRLIDEEKYKKPGDPIDYWKIEI